jgi:hypothetical protein
LVIITPDLCLGIIEVKTHLNAAQFNEAVKKLADNRLKISRLAQCRPFTGLFSFDHDGEDYQPLLQYMKEAAAKSDRRYTNCVSLGTSLFFRYWYRAPENIPRNTEIFRAYKLQDMAPAYFVHNVIEALCENSVLDNNHIWYPNQGKEIFTLGEIALREI